MRKVLMYTLPVLATVVFSGCATILGGGNSQTISINSDTPMKGKISYEDGKNGEQYFTTPATLNVERRSKDIKITSQNNEFDTKTQKSNVNPWFLGNIIFGGLPGSTTDLVGGAAWKYDETINLHSKDDNKEIIETNSKND